MPNDKTANACALMLISPDLSASADAAAKFGPQMEAALSGGEIACVLLRTTDPQAMPADKALQGLIDSAQRHGTALLVNGDALAARLGADGAHIRIQPASTSDDNSDGPPAALRAAVKRLKPDGIVGAGNLRTRHDAMAAGELDIDYVMFGEPAPDGYRPPTEAIRERIEWWSEIFTIPCVGYAASLEEAAELTSAGADFMVMDDAIWSHPKGPAEGVRAAIAALSAVPVL